MPQLVHDALGDGELDCAIGLDAIGLGCDPMISIPLTRGFRWFSHTPGFKELGAAEPAWVPTNRNAGPAPAITIRAVPSPLIDARPVFVRSIVTGAVIRYVPFGKVTAPLATAF
jgi:hypothetical protein